MCVYAMHISYGYDNNYVFISAVCVPTIPDRLHYVYIFLVNTNYLALFKPSAKPYEGPAKLLKTPSNIFVLDATLYARPSKPKPTETHFLLSVVWASVSHTPNPSYFSFTAITHKPYAT